MARISNLFRNDLAVFASIMGACTLGLAGLYEITALDPPAKIFLVPSFAAMPYGTCTTTIVVPPNGSISMPAQFDLRPEAAQHLRSLQFDATPLRAQSTEGPREALAIIRSDMIAMHCRNMPRNSYAGLVAKHGLSDEEARQEIIATARQAFTLIARDHVAAMQRMTTLPATASRAAQTAQYHAVMAEISGIDAAIADINHLDDTYRGPKTGYEILDPSGRKSSPEMRAAVVDLCAKISPGACRPEESGLNNAAAIPVDDFD